MWEFHIPWRVSWTSTKQEIPREFSVWLQKKSLKKSLEFQDPNPAVVLEAAVAADREWGVWGVEAPTTKSFNCFLPL